MIPLRHKKFPQTTLSGLGITKNGKLQYPFIFTAGENLSPTNNYGQSYPKVGDYVAYCMPSGILSSGTVGKIIDNDARFSHLHDGAFRVEKMDGTVASCYRYACGHLTEPQIRDVAQYYVQQKRPERVKAAWAQPLLSATAMAPMEF